MNNGVTKCALMEMAYRVSIYKDTGIVEMGNDVNRVLTVDFFEKNSDLYALVNMLADVIKFHTEDNF